MDGREPGIVVDGNLVVSRARSHGTCQKLLVYAALVLIVAIPLRLVSLRLAADYWRGVVAATGGAVRVEPKPKITPQVPQPPSVVAPAVVLVAPETIQTAVTPTCTPDAAYSLPASLDLSAAPSGLTQQIDAVHYYTVYGRDDGEIRSQIVKCAPQLNAGGDDYTGYTAYNLSWLYAYSPTIDGQCSLSDVRVGLHVGEVLPAWQQTAGVSGSFAAQMHDFVANLNVHEQGHVAIDKQYAAKLLTDLQSLTTPTCDSITASVKALVATDVAALNQANDNYDASTNHGATQGAIVP